MANKPSAGTTSKKRYKLEDLRGWLEGSEPPPIEEIREIHEGKAQVRKDFVKEFAELLKLATPMEHILLASKHPINPGQPGWEGRMADMFKHIWEMTKRRKSWN